MELICYKREGIEIEQVCERETEVYIQKVDSEIFIRLGFVPKLSFPISWQLQILIYMRKLHLQMEIKQLKQVKLLCIIQWALNEITSVLIRERQREVQHKNQSRGKWKHRDRDCRDVVRADSLLKPHQRFCYVSTLVLAQGN
jgi:hypothetical protein